MPFRCIGLLIVEVAGGSSVRGGNCFTLDAHPGYFVTSAHLLRNAASLDLYFQGDQYQLSAARQGQDFVVHGDLDVGLVRFPAIPVARWEGFRLLPDPLASQAPDAVWQHGWWDPTCAAPIPYRASGQRIVQVPRRGVVSPMANMLGDTPPGSSGSPWWKARMARH
jgi:hypothetical protein